MNKNLLNTIFIMCLISIFSCRSNHSELLGAIDKMEIPHSDSVQYIVYIPPNQCKNCLTLICDSTYDPVKSRIHLVLNQDTSLFRGFKNAYLEKDRAFFNIEEVNKSNKIIVFQNGKIQKIVKLGSGLEWIKDYDKAVYEVNGLQEEANQ